MSAATLDRRPITTEGSGGYKPPTPVTVTALGFGEYGDRRKERDYYGPSN